MFHACHSSGYSQMGCRASEEDIEIRKYPTGLEEWPWKYVARIPIVLFGSINDPETFHLGPFNELFHDNYAEGRGMTKEVALRKLKENFDRISRSIWD
jgi:hypothetical protein